MKKLIRTILIPVLLIFLWVSGCDLQNPSAPNWYVDANLPLLEKVHTIYSLLRNEHNIGYDENANAYLSDKAKSADRLQNKFRLNGTGDVNLKLPTMLDTMVAAPFDDSTFVTTLYFEASTPAANLSYTFQPTATNSPYTITITAVNLISGGQPLKITENISDKPKSGNIDLTGYNIQNPVPSNMIVLQVGVVSSSYETADISYNISPFYVRSVSGTIKPLSLGENDTTLLSPFGKHDISGSMDFVNINEAKTYIVVKRSVGSYQTDIKDIRFRGINNNGTVVDLKYLKYDTTGAPTQPIDSIFNVRLPAGVDSMVYPVNNTNSNIIEFIRNIPENIQYVHTVHLNSNYGSGTFESQDSVYFYLSIEVPFHFSILDPLYYQDTIIKKITDTLAIKRLKTTDMVEATLYLRNSLPLMASVRMYMLDSLNNLLFTVTQFMTNNNGADSVLLQAAPVDNDGYVTNYVEHTFTGIIDSLHVKQLLQMRKIVYSYRLYTDPNQIPTPDGKVRIRGTDYIKQTSFGTFKYLISTH